MPMLGAINGMLAQARQHYGQPQQHARPQQGGPAPDLGRPAMGGMIQGTPFQRPQPQDEPGMGNQMGQPFLSAVQMFNSLNRGMR